SKPVMKRFLAVSFLSLAVLGACGKKDVAPAASAKEPPALPTDVQAVATSTQGSVAPATQATTTDAVVATDAGGTIIATGEFVSPIRSELSVKMPGRVGAMHVDEGSRVTKGQPLLTLESDYTRLNLQRAEADVARARAMADDARRDVERKKGLIATNAIPQATMDRSQAAFDQAHAALASAQATAALLRQQVNDAVLRSPIDGVVAEKRTDVGQRLGDNTVALVVVQTSPLKLRFRVPERYLASVHKGQTVKATVDPYPGQVFEGRVTVVGGVIDSATRSLLVETEFLNRDGKLRPGLFARVELSPGS
ncbi:MAG: efflux RND transporter periplasmic adaptor subunit, partial [Thermoanaerobaculia bacterium]